MVSQSDYERDYERIVGSNGDPYAILGVARGCSAAEATKAYRRLALVFHPDKTSNTTSGFSTGKRQTQYKDQSEAAFKIISLACALLTDPAKRAKYDASVSARRPWSVNELDDAVANGGAHLDPYGLSDSIFRDGDGGDRFDSFHALAFHGRGESILHKGGNDVDERDGEVVSSTRSRSRKVTRTGEVVVKRQGQKVVKRADGQLAEAGYLVEGREPAKREDAKLIGPADNRDTLRPASRASTVRGTVSAPDPRRSARTASTASMAWDEADRPKSSVDGRRSMRTGSTASMAWDDRDRPQTRLPDDRRSMRTGSTASMAWDERDRPQTRLPDDRRSMRTGSTASMAWDDADRPASRVADERKSMRTASTASMDWDADDRRSTKELRSSKSATQLRGSTSDQSTWKLSGLFRKSKAPDRDSRSSAALSISEYDENGRRRDSRTSRARNSDYYAATRSVVDDEPPVPPLPRDLPRSALRDTIEPRRDTIGPTPRRSTAAPPPRRSTAAPPDRPETSRPPRQSIEPSRDTLAPSPRRSTVAPPSQRSTVAPADRPDTLRPPRQSSAPTPRTTLAPLPLVAAGPPSGPTPGPFGEGWKKEHNSTWSTSWSWNPKDGMRNGPSTSTSTSSEERYILAHDGSKQIVFASGPPLVTPRRSTSGDTARATYTLAR